VCAAAGIIGKKREEGALPLNNALNHEKRQKTTAFPVNFSAAC
jgi:hypothetical protein